MAWRRPGDKPLSESMVVSLLTHICVTRPQGVKFHSTTRCRTDVFPWATVCLHTKLAVKRLTNDIFKMCVTWVVWGKCGVNNICKWVIIGLDLTIQCQVPVEAITGLSMHDDVIKWKHSQCHWPFVRGIHRSLVNSPHTGQWRGAFMFSLICAWTEGWLNHRITGDLRRHRANYDVIVMHACAHFCYKMLHCWVFRLMHCGISEMGLYHGYWCLIPCVQPSSHYYDVIMSLMVSQITSLTIVYSTVYSVTDQRKHQSSASLAFVRGIHRWIPRTKGQ